MSRLRGSTAAALAGAALLAMPAATFAQDALGSWATEAVTDFGTFQATLTIAEGDGGYTVEFVDVPTEGGAGPGPGGPPPESTISDVVVDGSTFSFTRTMESPQGSFVLKYTGTVDGDALAAEANSDFGAIPVTGTRITE